jgi:DivIVA domain-containing protein
MPLTPADIHDVVFKKSPIGKRGYDKDEVDTFFGVVRAELVRLIEENNELRANGSDPRMEAQAAADRPSAVQAPPPLPAAPREDEAMHASRLLRLASETAERHVNEAKAQVDQMLSSAKANCERMLAEVRTDSDQMVAEAKMRADSLLSDAHTRADTMEREAHAKAAQLHQEAERKHAEVMISLEEQRTSLEHKVEELRTVEREYRTRLRSSLEPLMRALRHAARPDDDEEEHPDATA